MQVLVLQILDVTPQLGVTVADVRIDRCGVQGEAGVARKVAELGGAGIPTSTNQSSKIRGSIGLILG